MKTIVKQFSKNLALLIIVLVSVSFTEINAQDKYAFSTWSNQFNSSNDDAYYMIVSDPVKNWFTDMNVDERKEWITNFRVSANDQAGYSILKNYSEPIPEGGSYERFSSLSDCKEAIQRVVNKFKKDYSGRSKPVKIIYVNLNKY